MPHVTCHLTIVLLHLWMDYHRVHNIHCTYIYVHTYEYVVASILHTQSWKLQSDVRHFLIILGLCLNETQFDQT